MVALKPGTVVWLFAILVSIVGGCSLLDGMDERERKRRLGWF